MKSSYPDTGYCVTVCSLGAAVRGVVLRLAATSLVQCIGVVVAAAAARFLIRKFGARARDFVWIAWILDRIAAD